MLREPSGFICPHQNIYSLKITICTTCDRVYVCCASRRSSRSTGELCATIGLSS
ncbi:hypothetical protein TSAR_010216 [Trichomalopsis sarcophagae]|uniref:Uncharacterized protein n=1 Tax=Trichomalopsis sarcophagae TaxID=543379 RepID=A0A232FN95_9HYME|nr:hypothetical protein TSAR_010216 [Trichomalopsis sarcophagae]